MNSSGPKTPKSKKGKRRKNVAKIHVNTYSLKFPVMPTISALKFLGIVLVYCFWEKCCFQSFGKEEKDVM